MNNLEVFFGKMSIGELFLCESQISQQDPHSVPESTYGEWRDMIRLRREFADVPLRVRCKVICFECLKNLDIPAEKILIISDHLAVVAV